MTTGGWITFLLSVSGVCLFFGFCLWRVLTSKKPEKLHGTFEFEDED